MTPEFKATTLAHLIWMASMPGAKDHAWFRAKQLAREWPQMFGDLPQLLTEAMRNEPAE